MPDFHDFPFRVADMYSYWVYPINKNITLYRIVTSYDIWHSTKPMKIGDIEIDILYFMLFNL